MLPYAPLQESLEDIPVIEWDVMTGLEGLEVLLERKKLREFLICPAAYKGSPMTPRMHPTGGRSYHIVRLVHPEMPGTLVDLLFCDQNMYMLATRRFVPGNPWSEWFYFRGQWQHMPSFFSADDCKEMPIKVSHNESLKMAGGEYTVPQNIFHVLADPKSSTKAKEQVLFCAVIILCEVTRIVVVMEGTFRRLMDYGCTDTSIAGILWTFMKSWSKLSKCALDNRKRVRARDVVAVEPRLLANVSDCGINNVDEVIGQNGQLRLILLEGADIETYNNVEYPADFQDRFPNLDEKEQIMAAVVEDVTEG